MSESVFGTTPRISGICHETVEAYRLFGKTVQSPAIRKLLESIITQKSEHVAVLRPFDAFSGSLAVTRIAIPPDAVAAKILECVVEHEARFAESLDVFSRTMADEESRMTIKGIADASRKFTSWATDHLDFMVMFQR